MVKKFYERAIAVWGILFFVFLLGYWVRLISLSVIFLVAFAFVKILRIDVRRAINRISCWSNEKERQIVIVLFAIALFLRIAWMLFLRFKGLSTDFSDYHLLWKNAIDMANGIMPISKSWATAGFYAISVKLFGPHLTAAYVLTMFLQLATVAIGYVFCRRVLGVFPAICFMTFGLLSPNIIVLSTVTATENIFAFFFVLSVVVLNSFILNGKPRYVLALGIILWLSTWSRGEGIILWVAAVLVMVISSVIRKGDLRATVSAVLALLMIFLIGSFGAIRINEACCGDRTIFCSNDNLIPRYMGSVIKDAGRFTPEIYREFDRLNGEGSVARAHNGDRNSRIAWFTFLKERTSQNWSRMDWSERIKFVIHKEIIDWWGYGTMGLATTRVIYEIIFAPFAAIMFALALLFYLRLWHGKCSCFCSGYLTISLAGIVSVLAISEAQPRYGYLVYWAVPWLVALLLKSLVKSDVR